MKINSSVCLSWPCSNFLGAQRYLPTMILATSSSAIGDLPSHVMLWQLMHLRFSQSISQIVRAVCMDGSDQIPDVPGALNQNHLAAQDRTLPTKRQSWWTASYVTVEKSL